MALHRSVAYTALSLRTSSTRLCGVRYISSTINNITIEHEEFGAENAGRDVILIMGHSGSKTLWSMMKTRENMTFPEILSARGFRTIVFDNRDMGQTQKFGDVLPNPMPFALDWMTPEEHKPKEGDEGYAPLPDGPSFAYTMDDMADDVVGVLDHYGIEKAHVIGASMGGGITHITGMRHPERCKTLVPIFPAVDYLGAMASAAEHFPDFMPGLMKKMQESPVQPDMTVDEYVDNRCDFFEGIQMGGNPEPGFFENTMDAIRAGFREDYLRKGVDWDGSGGFRQSCAMAQWAKQENIQDRSSPYWQKLKDCQIPTLVLHGTDDPILGVEAGRELADIMPNARFVEYTGGHNFGHQHATVDFFLAAIFEHLCTNDPHF